VRAAGKPLLVVVLVLFLEAKGAKLVCY